MPHNAQAQVQARGTDTPLFRTKAKGQFGSSQDADRLDDVTELLSGWVWETDADHRFTYMSNGVEKFTCRPSQWHYGKTRAELGNRCETDPMYLNFARNLEARRPFNAVEFSRVDGAETIHMRTTGKPMYVDGVFTGYRGIAICINSEVRERQLRRAAESHQLSCSQYLESVIRHYPQAIVAFDADLRLLFVNDRYYELMQLSPGELRPPATFHSVLTLLIARGELRGGSPDEIIERHTRLARAGKPFVIERCRPNGRIISISGFPLPDGGFVRTLIDVTERTEDKWTIANLKSQIGEFAHWR